MQAFIFDLSDYHYERIFHKANTDHEIIFGLIRHIVTLPDKHGDAAFEVLCTCLSETCNLPKLSLEIRAKAERFMQEAPGYEDQGDYSLDLAATAAPGATAVVPATNAGQSDSVDGLPLPSIPSKDPVQDLMHQCTAYMLDKCQQRQKRLQHGVHLLPAVSEAFFKLESLSELQATHLCRRGRYFSKNTSFELKQVSDVLGSPACPDNQQVKIRSFPAANRSLIVSRNVESSSLLCSMVLADFAKPETESCLRGRYAFPVYLSPKHPERYAAEKWEVLLGLADNSRLDMPGDSLKNLKSALAKCSEKILFVVDDLDLSILEPHPRSILHQVIRGGGSEFLQASVIGTVRPCLQAEECVQYLDNWYCLLEREECQLQMLFDRQLGPDFAAKCMSELQKPDMAHIKSTVMASIRHATSLCDVYMERLEIPSSISQLFKMFLVKAASKMETGASLELIEQVTSNTVADTVFGQGQSISLLTLIEHELDNQILCQLPMIPQSRTKGDFQLFLDICREAYNTVHTGAASRLSIPVESSLNNMVHHLLGWLDTAFDSQEVVEADSLWCIFCAARFVAVSENPSSMAQNILGKSKKSEMNINLFCRFVCSFLEERKLRSFLLMVQETAGQCGFQKRELTRLLLLCFMDSLGKSPSHKRGTNVVARGNGNPSEGYVKAAWIVAKHGINLHGLPLELSDAKALQSVLYAISFISRSCPYLDLVACGLSEEGVHEVVLSLHKCEQVDLSGNNLGGRAIRQLGKFCNNQLVSNDTACSLNSLTLQWCSLSNDDGQYASLCLRLPSLCSLDLSGNRLGNGGLHAFRQWTMPCSNIKYLNLSRTGLLQGIADDISKIVLQLPNLEDLVLSNNGLVAADVFLIIRNLHKNQRLKYLALDGNSIDASIEEAFIKSDNHQQCQQEREVTVLLHNNPPLDVHKLRRSASQWSPMLTVYCGQTIVSSEQNYKVGLLSKLDQKPGDLSGLGLRDCLFPNLRHAMVQCREESRRPWVNLSGNHLARRFAEMMRDTFHSLKWLRVLCLSSNALDTPSATILLNGLSKSPAVSCLDLSYNPLFIADTSELSVKNKNLFLDAIKLCPKLLILNLCHCNISDDVGCDIIRALNVSSLAMLSMERNGLRDRSAEALAYAKMDFLEIVSVACNQIGVVGAQCLSRTDLPAVRHIWMKGNICDVSRLATPLSDKAFPFSGSLQDLNLNELSKFCSGGNTRAYTTLESCFGGYPSLDPEENQPDTLTGMHCVCHIPCVHLFSILKNYKKYLSLNGVLA